MSSDSTNIMDTHRARTSRLQPIAATVIAVACLALTTGCTAKDDPAVASPEPSVTATPSATTATSDPAAIATTPPPTVRPTTGVCSYGDLDTAFTGKAADTFGVVEVTDAYCEAAQFFHGKAATSIAAPSSNYTVRDLSFVRDYLTISAKQDWDATAAKAIAGNEQAVADINALTFFNLQALTGLGYQFPESGVMTTGGGVSAAQTQVKTLSTGQQALTMWFTVDTILVLEKDVADPRGLAGLPVAREVVITMVANPSGGPEHDWLIDSWKTSWTSTNIKPLERLLAP